MKNRKAQFAGSWYPASAAACEKEIRSFLGEKSAGTPEISAPVGGIVPHAGWYFSGSIACRVIEALAGGDPPDIVIVFGMHLHPGSRPCLMTEGGWETPFGILPVAEDLAGHLKSRFRFREETPDIFTPDNTIELQLPFVKYFFRDARLLTVGAPPREESLRIAETLMDRISEKGLKAGIIGSTDLTHYGSSYGFAPKGRGPEALEWMKNTNDRKFIDAVLSMSPETVIQEGLKNHNACCSGAAGAAVSAVRKMGAEKAETLAYATSHDRHPGDSYVGYAGILFG